ncbi:MAG: hypothetical protein DME00_29450 [Candidatus Rokuibacteriota bacterium]|nr:MAG: hypothetical protein DME00_29450 [Candidatus Rokubacteria bacterium]PYO10996.1 MAG: hypothetical protein DMD75_12000 [Candidatus Rokubacteria bacterium]
MEKARNFLEVGGRTSRPRSNVTSSRTSGHPDGYNLGVNVGEGAGQTVGPAHLHLIPRYRGDVDDPRGGIRWILPAKAPY